MRAASKLHGWKKCALVRDARDVAGPQQEHGGPEVDGRAVRRQRPPAEGVYDDDAARARRDLGDALPAGRRQAGHVRQKVLQPVLPRLIRHQPAQKGSGRRQAGHVRQEVLQPVLPRLIRHPTAHAHAICREDYCRYRALHLEREAKRAAINTYVRQGQRHCCVSLFLQYCTLYSFRSTRSDPREVHPGGSRHTMDVQGREGLCCMRRTTDSLPK